MIFAIIRGCVCGGGGYRGTDENTFLKKKLKERNETNQKKRKKKESYIPSGAE